MDQGGDALWADYGNGASVMIGSGFSLRKPPLLLRRHNPDLVQRPYIGPHCEQLDAVADGRSISERAPSSESPRPA